MAYKNTKSISACDQAKVQIDELKEMKMELEQLQNELTVAQTKYYQRLTDYEAKFEQLHCQAEKAQVEQEEKEANLLNATSEWRDTKAKLESSVMTPDQKVKLNVGGRYFETTMETLTKHSEGTMSYFKTLFSRQWQLEKDSKDESIFIDRSGDFFHYILQYLRTGQLIIDVNDVILRRNLMIEAEFYKINNLIGLLKTNTSTPRNPSIEQRQLYSNSRILTPERQAQLNKLYGIDSQRWNLIYRASQDGFTAELFHKRCDGHAPTMTVIRSLNGYTFGGFTAVRWSTSNEDKSDAHAFLFTLKNPHNIKPTKYLINEHSVRFAVSHRTTNGPTFGSVGNGGSDIYLRDPFNTIGSRIFFPRTYKDVTNKGRSTFSGDSYFACEDVEIFLLVS